MGFSVGADFLSWCPSPELPLVTKRVDTPKAQPNLVRVKMLPIVHAVSNGGS